MAFRVDPDAVQRFAAASSDLAGQADRARRYAVEHLGISPSEGNIFVNVVAQAATLSQGLEANYAHMRRLLDDAGAELGRSATTYRGTDRASAERLDATYGGPP